jgi:phage shock protein E
MWEDLVMQGLLSLAFLLGSLALAGEGSYEGRKMVEAAQDLMTKGVTVIDVRQEACDGYVKGAKLISIDEITKKDPVALRKISEYTKNNKLAPIAVYCKGGVRAEKAKKVLQSLGYANVQNLGGIQDYHNSQSMEKCGI